MGLIRKKKIKYKYKSPVDEATEKYFKSIDKKKLKKILNSKKPHSSE